MSVEVHAEVPDDQFVGRNSRVAAALDESMEPDHHFFDREWLGHVIVSPSGKAVDAIRARVHRRQEESRDFREERSNPLKHSDPVDPWKQPVQHQDIWAVLSRNADGIEPVAARANVSPEHAEGKAHQIGDRRVILDDENGNRGSIRVFEVREGGDDLRGVW